jgi:hypothetical protein
VSANTSAAVTVLPSIRQTGGSGSGQGAAGSGAAPPGPVEPAAGIGWLGMSSRICLKAHLLNGGSCQLARVTRASGTGGKLVMRSCEAAWVMKGTLLIERQHAEP